MTKPREKTREELQAEIEDGKKKIRQYENREKMLRQKLSKEERRTRSHRLIVRGAVFESIVPCGNNSKKHLTKRFMQRVDMRLLRRYLTGNTLLGHVLHTDAHGQALLNVPGLSRSATPILLPQNGHSNTRWVDSPSRHLMANISSIETSSFAQGLSTLSMSSKPVHTHTHVAQNGALGRTGRRSELEGVRAVAPLRLAPVSAGRPLLHFLSTGARCVCASYTIPLIRMRGDTPCYL